MTGPALCRRSSIGAWPSSELAQAGDDDVIVIAGKGHETYQVTAIRSSISTTGKAELALKNRYGNHLKFIMKIPYSLRRSGAVFRLVGRFR